MLSHAKPEQGVAQEFMQLLGQTVLPGAWRAEQNSQIMAVLS